MARNFRFWDVVREVSHTAGRSGGDMERIYKRLIHSYGDDVFRWSGMGDIAGEFKTGDYDVTVDIVKRSNKIETKYTVKLDLPIDPSEC